MTERKKQINYIVDYIKQNNSISIDDLVELAQMSDYDVQHKYLQFKYKQ